MRSNTEYILTKSEVQAEAEHWLATSLRLEYEGYKCTKSVLLQILLLAAARVVSLFAACRDLADAPYDQTVRNALAATLPEIGELERRLNLALVTRLPKEIREIYRKRFGIETSYRQMNEARIKTCSRDPPLRLLLLGIALVLRNVWVWLHFRFAKDKYSDEPELFLELLRFREMLLWITEVVQETSGADKTLGLDRQTYERLTATRRK